jgi:hypothetical protein
MSNWIKGTNFHDHYVALSDPTDQVVIRGNKIFALPEDYTMLDQLFDQEAFLDLISEEVMEGIRASMVRVGERTARDILLIDNTVYPPELRQVPLEDGSLGLSEAFAKQLVISSHGLEEIYG